MTPEELFTAALGLGQQWRVVECRFEGEPKRLELRLEHVPGEHFECPHCKAFCGVHDTLERRWRHLNFFQYRCELVAKVPRTWCRKDGVHQVQVPWAREGSGFTLMMEALVMLLSAQMPVDGIADLDCDGGGLLLMVEGRSAEALGSFAQALREHGGDPTQIQVIAMDMSPAYLKGAAQYFPQAQIVFDKFHVMLMAGQALETVRRELQNEGAELKGSLWSLRGNAWNLSAERQQQRRVLCLQYTKLGRAMTLRETLQAIYASPDQASAEGQLQWWCDWASRSRLEPFRTLAKTVRQHWEGILAYFDTGLTSAAIEAINGIIQLAKRMARGFKNFVYFRTAAYLRAGRLKFELPAIN